MKSQKDPKEKINTTVKVPAPMDQTLLTNIRDQTKTRVEQLIEEAVER